MISWSDFPAYDSRPLWPMTAPKSRDYRVFVGGTEIPVYNCRISKFPFNRPWPGYQRSADQAEDASYVNIVSDGAVEITVVSGLDCSRVLLKPYSKEIVPTVEGQKITFSLPKNGQFVLECGSYHHCLYLFNSAPIPAPDPESVTHYFGPGIHFPGKITLRSNESIYVDKDALVYGCIYAKNAQNIRIFGNGVFDDSHEGRIDGYCYEEYTNGNLKFYDCTDVHIAGVLLKDSAVWCLNLFHCFRVTVEDVKIFGQWRYNTDGIDIVNSQEVVIRDSFVHSFDDTVSIKGIPQYWNTDVENILVENCVLWCDWGNVCECGIETMCRAYRNVTFRNCDVLRGGNAVLSICNGICAEISLVTFEDIRVEYNAFDTREHFQSRDDEVYDPGDSLWVPRLILLQSIPWSEPGYPAVPAELIPGEIPLRHIHDITVRNIQVYYDPLLPQPEGRPCVPVCIMGEHSDRPYHDIHISDIFINGNKATAEDLGITAINVTGLTVE